MTFIQTLGVTFAILPFVVIGWAFAIVCIMVIMNRFH